MLTKVTEALSTESTPAGMAASVRTWSKSARSPTGASRKPIGEMAYGSRVTPGHSVDGDNAYLALRTDRVGSYEQLLRFAVNQTVGGGAADTFGLYREIERRRDFVKSKTTMGRGMPTTIPSWSPASWLRPRRRSPRFFRSM